MLFNKDKKSAASPSASIAMLPLRDLVVFPYMVVPLIVGRKSSIKALESASDEDKKILQHPRSQAPRIQKKTTFSRQVPSPTSSRCFDCRTAHEGLGRGKEPRQDRVLQQRHRPL